MRVLQVILCAPAHLKKTMKIRARARPGVREAKIYVNIREKVKEATCRIFKCLT